MTNLPWVMAPWGPLPITPLALEEVEVVVEEEGPLLLLVATVEAKVLMYPLLLEVMEEEEEPLLELVEVVEEVVVLEILYPSLHHQYNFSVAVEDPVNSGVWPVEARVNAHLVVARVWMHVKAVVEVHFQPHVGVEVAAEQTIHFGQTREFQNHQNHQELKVKALLYF